MCCHHQCRRPYYRARLFIYHSQSSYYHHLGSGYRHDENTLAPSTLWLFSIPRTNFSSQSSSISVQDTAEDGDATLTLEETYTRLTPLEHILHRPAMYIGETERSRPTSSWVLKRDIAASSATGSNNDQFISSPPSSPWAMEREEISSFPALLKVFDEILVNASDNRIRHPKTCNQIDVIIHRGDVSSKPYISIKNNGISIPVVIHKKENIYVPELLFGHLLTGSNFNDDQKRLTGGRHGYGAKLTNVFSKEFVVEIRDCHSSKGECRTYKQTWENNMHTCHKPEVRIEKKMDGKNLDYTKISFVPDLVRLTKDSNMILLPEEAYKLMCRRVIDIAGCSGGKLTVTLNGETIGVNGFEDYLNLYRPALSLPPMVYHNLNPRWEVAVGLSDTKSMESISFVNGMNTSRGGSHVDILADQVSNYIADHINKTFSKRLGISVSPRMVRRNLLICVNCMIENPSFDTQMKDCLTSNPKSFGSQYELSKKFLSKLVIPVKSPRSSDVDENSEDDIVENMATVMSGGPGIVEEVLKLAVGAEKVNISRLLNKFGSFSKQQKSQVLAIPKLEDANLAGGRKSLDCTLILTEGDSAKALAVAGLEIVGRDNYGVFPLRGKLLNVREVSKQRLVMNTELRSLCAILGLQFNMTYKTWDERKNLRYGHVMLMTDQDADGSHIKGLFMNFLRYFWPALLQPPIGNSESDEIDDRPFLSMFVTPLLKVSKKGKKKEHEVFFSMAGYNKWRESLDEEEIRKWSIKYYKGLGTSTSVEAKEYFAAFIKHHRPLRWQSESEDGWRIDMAFGKDRADDRKDWILKKYDIKSTLSIDENDGNSVTYGDFIDSELIHFSNANNIRALPSVIDGLKPSQRKVLYACFKRNLKDEVKVAQLAGYCAEHTAYHHGEASLYSTIIGMAQDFVGSNNINLLTPSGQFGTRLMGGNDAASPRYIFTYLSPLARLLFPEADDTASYKTSFLLRLF
jgi:DNA topoisomerase-2